MLLPLMLLFPLLLFPLLLLPLLLLLSLLMLFLLLLFLLLLALLPFLQRYPLLHDHVRLFRLLLCPLQLDPVLRDPLPLCSAVGLPAA